MITRRTLPAFLFAVVLAAANIPPAAAYINGKLPGESRGEYEDRIRREARDRRERLELKLQTELAPYEETIRRSPQDGVGYYQRALVYERNGKLQLAEADLVKAIELAPDLARAWYRKFFYKKEVGDLERAVKLDPEFAPAQAELSQSYTARALSVPAEREEYLQRALKAAEQACAATKHCEPLALVLLADAHSARGEFDLATKALKNANANTRTQFEGYQQYPLYWNDLKAGLEHNELKRTYVHKRYLDTRRMLEKPGSDR